jgi:FkbM family methyltransferase
MNFLNKIYNYYFAFSINKILFHFTLLFNGNIYSKLFNFYSLFYNSKNRIIFRDRKYFCIEKKWIFSQKKVGLYAYGKGFDKRILELSSTYHIDKINFKDDDNIIDIGANNGDLYLCFKDKINYYGFEPSPEIFLNLKHNVPNQNIFNLGLWNKSNKDIDFYLSDEFGDSSIIPINKFSKKISIKTTTLNEVIEKINSRIKLLKIEAEGAEPEILEGLSDKLNMVEYITIDCGFERGVNQDSTISECSNYLIKNNFSMVGFNNPRIVVLFKNNNLIY